MKNLISLSDFVLEQQIRMSSPEIFKSKVYAYANFLKQPLTLEMFVAVDKHGVVLEPLQFCCNSSDCGCMGMPVNVSSQEEIDEYYEAEEKVLFEGFHVEWRSENIIGVMNETKVSIAFDNTTGQHGVKQNIEYLVSYGLTLTPSALQQIGIKE